MLPPPLQSIASDIRLRVCALLRSDPDRLAIPDLLSAAEVYVEFTRELGRGLLQDFVDVCAADVIEGRAPCSCGRQMEVLRRRTWTHKTLVGPIAVPDPYLYCRFCHERSLPMQARMGTEREVWSMGVQEAAVDLASDESCGKAVAKLARHHPGVEMGRTTALEMLHHHGASAREFIDDKLDHLRRQHAAEVIPNEPAPELETEMDASMIPVATLEPIVPPAGEEPKRTPIRRLLVRRKHTRWEEVKAGLVQRPGEKEARLFTLRPTAGVDACFEDLPCLAVLLGRTRETQVRGIADGAVHIRLRMEEQFRDGPFKFILDRPHCKEHLSEVGALLAPSTGISAQDWARKALEKLEQGNAAELVSELRAAHEASGSDPASRIDGLRLAANYFERNADAVEYAAYRQKGWGTASSEIESGHRYTVQARMKISGAWWHPGGVDDILALRMLKANGWWTDYWTWKRQQWMEHARHLSETSPAAA